MIFSIFLLKTLLVGTHRLSEVVLTAEAVLMSTHNLCFGSKIRKIVYPCVPHFYNVKVGFKVVTVSPAYFPDVLEEHA